MSDSYYYEYEQDSFYCYTGTYTLKNKMDILDSVELRRAEREITSLRTAQLMQETPEGKFDFSRAID